MTNEYTKPESFFKNGFVLIEDVLTKEEVAALRKKLHRKLNAEDKNFLTISDILSEEDIYRIQFSPKILNVLRAVYGGKFEYINHFNLQYNMVDNSGPAQGWHLDADSECDPTPSDYLFDPTYRHGKIGVYLQDNTQLSGGSIDAIVGGHRPFLTSSRNKMIRILKAYLDRHLVNPLRKKWTVPIRAGSALFFDPRLPHRSTPVGDPQIKTIHRDDAGEVALLPEDRSKYVIYWESGNRLGVDTFMDHMKKRAITEELAAKKKQPFFSDTLRYNYPTDYPETYRKYVESVDGLGVASLEPAAAEVFKRVYETRQPARQ